MASVGYVAKLKLKCCPQNALFIEAELYLF